MFMWLYRVQSLFSISMYTSYRLSRLPGGWSSLEGAMTHAIRDRRALCCELSLDGWYCSLHGTKRDEQKLQRISHSLIECTRLKPPHAFKGQLYSPGFSSIASTPDARCQSQAPIGRVAPSDGASGFTVKCRFHWGLPNMPLCVPSGALRKLSIEGLLG